MADSASMAGGQDLRAALHAEPTRLQAQLDAVDGELHELSLANYRVHVSNHHCDADVRSMVGSTMGMLSPMHATAAALEAAVTSLQGELAPLHASHVRLRNTAAQHALVTELLQAPGLMETCLRAGLYDEALDIAEYASSLYFTHQLWRGEGVEGDASSDGDGRGHGSTVVGGVVADIRRLCLDLRDALHRQLTGKVALPTALRLLHHLRRLYTQERVSRSRMAAVLHPTTTPAGNAATAAASAAAYALTAEDDESIVEQLHREFLACRDTYHRAELDALNKHNLAQFAMKAVDLQRAHWGEVAAQFTAVCSTVRPTSTTATGAPSQWDGGHAMLMAWLAGRLAWCNTMLAACVDGVNDFASLASLAQAVTYAARRAAKLGCEYEAFPATLLVSRAGEVLDSKLQACVASFREDVCGWQWAYRAGGYDPKSLVRDGGSSLGDAIAATPPPGPGSEAGEALPPSLLPFPPAADLANALVAVHNASREFMPLAGIHAAAQGWAGVATGCMAGLHAATLSDRCPLVAATGHAAPAHRRMGGGSGSGTVLTMSDDDRAAISRFGKLCRVFVEDVIPLLRRMVHALAGGAGGHVVPPDVVTACEAELTASATAALQLARRMLTELHPSGASSVA